MQHPTSQDLARAELDRRYQAVLREMDDAQLERIADRPTDREPSTAEEADRLLGFAIADLVAATFEASARSLDLARGLLAKRRDDGRRAALARALSEQAQRVIDARAARAAVYEKAARWKDHPCFTISAPLADFLPKVFDFVDGMLDLAQLRVHAACTGCSEQVLSALGVTVTAAARRESPPECTPETDEELVALMAEILS